MKAAFLLALGGVTAVVLGFLVWAVVGDGLATDASPDAGTEAPVARETRPAPERTARGPSRASRPPEASKTESARNDTAAREDEYDENSVDLDKRFPVADCVDAPRPGEEGKVDPESQRTLVGRIVDPESLAVASARVVAIARGNPSERVETTSAMDGSFRLEVASADEDRDLEVTHEEYGRKTFRVRPSRRVETGDAEVPVGDLVLDRAGSVSGFVRIAGGAPGSGLEVVLNGPLPGARPTSELVSPGHQFALRRAKEDGSFAFDKLAPGRYSVEVHPGPEDGLSEIEHEIELAAGQEIRDVTLVLRPTSQVEITVVDGDGRPVAGLGVGIELVEPAEDVAGVEGEVPRIPVSKTAATGPDGRATFSNASPGRYKASVDGQGARATAAEASEFELSDDSGTVRLTITVRPSGTIAGRVVDGGGEPVPNIVVVATATSLTDGVAQVRTAISGPNGAFAIAGLLETEYRLDAMDLAAPPESRILATREEVAVGSSGVEIAVPR